MTIERRAVQSGNIRSIGYSPEARVLAVEFISGGIYEYGEVPSMIAEAMLGAESKGKFFASRIKGLYPCTKVN